MSILDLFFIQEYNLLWVCQTLPIECIKFILRNKKNNFRKRFFFVLPCLISCRFYSTTKAFCVRFHVLQNFQYVAVGSLCIKEFTILYLSSGCYLLLYVKLILFFSGEFRLTFSSVSCHFILLPLMLFSLKNKHFFLIFSLMLDICDFLQFFYFRIHD